jgi:hypothetical protein
MLEGFMTVDPTKPTLSRRRLLRAGGGLAAAAAIGSAPLVAPAMAQADAGDSPRFNVPGRGDHPINQKSLHANWVMQSFGYDNINQHIYFLQHNVDNTDPKHDGDLWVTKTDTAGNELGAMALHKFGHGVSIGVEPYNGSVYLWTEWQVSKTSTFGTKVGRFKFVDGASLEETDTSIQDRTPSIGDTMVNPQPAIDPWSDRLLVRYRVGSTEVRIVGFSMTDARAGRVSTDDRMFERRIPDRTDGLDFQGYTALGRYAYLLYGKVSPTSFITTIDLKDVGQSIVEDFETSAGSTLPGREPQGMAVWLAPTGSRLAFGFHSNTDGERHANVFDKNQFV